MLKLAPKVCGKAGFRCKAPKHYKILAGGTIAQIEDLKRDVADYERRHLKKTG